MRRLKIPLLFLWMSLPGLAVAAPINSVTVSKAQVSTAAAAARAAPVANRVFTVGTLRVQQYGDHGRALILIPGLASGTWVWQGTIAHFAKDHVIYAVTLAGFDGVPAPRAQTGLLGLADAALLELIRTHHIEKPMLIGHSLGATLAIRFATEHAALLSGVVAVDGLPVFPLLNAGQREAAAQRMRMQIGHILPHAFAAQQLRFMRTLGLVNPERAKYYAALSARSNPATTDEYLAEDFDLDLCPQLKHITVPLLEISPYYKPDYVRYAQLNRRPFTTARQKAAYYRQLLDGVPQLRVVSIRGARYFVMLDRPQKFFATLAAFMAGLPKQ